MAGYWLEPDTGECVQVTTHDEWVRDQKNAESLGIPHEIYAEIMRHPPTAVDEIRTRALKCGLVRIREHKWHISVQFWADANRLASVLRAVVVALNGIGIHPDTRLIIDNLLSGERVVMTFRELDAAVENGASVFPSQG